MSTKECKGGMSIDNATDRASGNSNYARELSTARIFIVEKTM